MLGAIERGDQGGVRSGWSRTTHLYEEERPLVEGNIVPKLGPEYAMEHAM